MKRILGILLLLSPILVSAQHSLPSRFDYGPGEYVNSFVDHLTGRLYEYEGVPRLLSPLHMWKTVGGAHHSVALDSLTNGGNVYAWGDNTSGELGIGNTTNQNNPVQITIDSLGNPFNNIIAIQAGGTDGGWISGALKANGTVWVWGEVTDGVRGNGTPGGLVLRPVQVPFPAGVVIKQVVINELCIALDTDGNVWTWGAKNEDGGFRTPYMLAQGSGTSYVTNSPTKITLPLPAVMIAGGSDYTNYAVLTNGRLYGWGYNLQYMGVRGARDMSNYAWKPFDLTDTLNLTAGTIDSLVINSMATNMLKRDGSLWGWGDNSCANMGGGQGIDFRHYRTNNVPSGFPQPWAWDGGQIEVAQFKPVAIAPGMKFSRIFAGFSFCFEFYAANTGDTVCSWGRNKYQVADAFFTELSAANGNLGADYANNWDRNYVKTNFPFRTTAIVRTTARICKDSAGVLCNLFPWDGSKAGPIANANANQTIATSFTTLKGVPIIASGVSGKAGVLWSLVSKPAGAPTPVMPLRAEDTINVSNLTTNGVYTFKYWVEDANFKVDSNTMTVTVNNSGGSPPTVTAGSNQTITLPIASVSVTGTATGNSGATITSTQWAQQAGPNTATIASAGSLTTLITGLIAGTYVFQLTATDSNGLQNNASLTVNVLAAGGSSLQVHHGRMIRWK